MVLDINIINFNDKRDYVQFAIFVAFSPRYIIYKVYLTQSAISPQSRTVSNDISTAIFTHDDDSHSTFVPH